MESSDLNKSKAMLAYTIIQDLLSAHEALSDLLVVMSHALEEDVIKALTNTAEWQSYLESKRTLETTKQHIADFTAALKDLENA